MVSEVNFLLGKTDKEMQAHRDKVYSGNPEALAVLMETNGFLTPELRRNVKNRVDVAGLAMLASKEERRPRSRSRSRSRSR